MRPTDALALLVRLLDEHGVPVTRTSPSAFEGPGRSPVAVLEAFCAMARTPADDPIEHERRQVRVGDDHDCDLLLHESGLTGDARDRYVVWLTRQFAFEDVHGEYAGMNTVSIEIQALGLPHDRIPTSSTPCPSRACAPSRATSDKRAGRTGFDDRRRAARRLRARCASLEPSRGGRP